MDSGNTSSLHSSSGGASDDVDSLSAFFHTSASPSPSGVTLPPPPLLSSVGPHFFDYSSLFYLDSSSSSSSSPATLLPSASGSQPSETAVGPQTDPPPAPAPAPAPRSSRKRSRASRRAPTTVLTTDASNFRAMVQEFTGIPAAPFGVPAAASSPFLRSRIDQLLRPSSSSAAAAAAASPFLLGPFPHNPHSSPSFPTPIHNPPPPLPPSLNLTSPASATVTAAVTNSNSNQLTPNLHYLLQPPTPATFFSSDDFADLPQAALMLPDPAPSSWATVEFSGANVSQPLIGAASSCKPSYSSSAAPAAELVIRAKNIDSEIAGKRADGEADPSWIHSSSD